MKTTACSSENVKSDGWLIVSAKVAARRLFFVFQAQKQSLYRLSSINEASHNIFKEKHQVNHELNGPFGIRGSER